MGEFRKERAGGGAQVGGGKSLWETLHQSKRKGIFDPLKVCLQHLHSLLFVCLFWGGRPPGTYSQDGLIVEEVSGGVECLRTLYPTISSLPDLPLLFLRLFAGAYTAVPRGDLMPSPLWGIPSSDACRHAGGAPPHHIFQLRVFL